jgi:hypothetical protein
MFVRTEAVQGEPKGVPKVYKREFPVKSQVLLSGGIFIIGRALALVKNGA